MHALEFLGFFVGLVDKALNSDDSDACAWLPNHHNHAQLVNQAIKKNDFETSRPRNNGKQLTCPPVQIGNCNSSKGI